MKTVILAGGLGTIISKESHLKPKPMFESGERQRLELEYFSKRNSPPYNITESISLLFSKISLTFSKEKRDFLKFSL